MAEKEKKRIRNHVGSAFYIKASELKQLPPNYPPMPESIDGSALFPNGALPDELDIGCGRGNFLLTMAERYPGKNFLGIEIREPLVLKINETAADKQLANCRALWYNVANGMPFIPNASIENIYYFFPDPWFKKKHYKRRAFNTDFLEEVHRILKTGGKLWLATDVPDVDAYQTELAISSGYFDLKEITDPEEWPLPLTNKEKSCIEKGIPFTRRVCRKDI
jgi:tRNA (guanine-N7-)-methyltransferase